MLWRVFALRISHPPPTLRGPSCARARYEITYRLRRKSEQSLSARCIESTRCPVASKLSVMNHRRFAFLGDLPSPSIFVPPLARTTHSPTLPREPRKVHPTSLPAETLFLCFSAWPASGDARSISFARAVSPVFARPSPARPIRRRCRESRERFTPPASLNSLLCSAWPASGDARSIFSAIAVSPVFAWIFSRLCDRKQLT